MTTYIDASILVDALDDQDSAERERARAAMLACDERVASVLAWDEVVWVAKKQRGKAAAVAVGERLLQLPAVQFVPATREHIVKAQDLLQQFNLRPRDAIHVATALATGCEAILSLDNDFDGLPIAWKQP